MKRTALITLSAILILVTSLPAQDTAANDAYIKAMTSNDVGEKATLLKDWVATYGGKGQQYENFACATLCTINYPGKTPEDIINYGEKAITLGGLDDSTKCQVLLQVSAVYTHKGQNLAKAKNYSQQIVQISQAAKGKESEANNAKMWNQLVGAGYFTKAQAMEKNGELKDAVTAYINSYNILKNKQIITSIAKLGKSLYDSKAYADAEKAFATAVPILKDYGSTTLYAKTLHRLGKKSEAINYYKQSYGKKRSGEIAYNIALLLAPQAQTSATVGQETVQFFLEASFLSPANSKKAMEYAQGLYFKHNPAYNEKIQALQTKSKNLETLTNTFNSKFGEKEEEELSEAEKKEMNSILAQIDSEHKAITTLQTEQQTELEKFNQLIAQTKQKLGINS